jgi:multisubunit Na+/H+ antiporter MnhB subunit
MVVPIILLYAFGVIFLILALETEKPVKEETFKNNENNSINDLIYVGLSIFFNIIAYFASYSQADFVTLAYIPLALAIASGMLLLYRVYDYLPKGTDAFGDETEDEDWKHRDNQENKLHSY